MANTVTFQGGPCNGRTATYTDAQLRSGIVSCGGVPYAVLGQSPGVYTAIPASQQVQPPSSFVTYAPDLFKAYGDLRRSIVHRLRPAITQARRYDRIALQTLARRSRVRGR